MEELREKALEQVGACSLAGTPTDRSWCRLGRTVTNVGLACARTAVWIPTLQKETSLMLRSNKIMEKTQLKRSNASRSSIPSDIEVPLLRKGEPAQYML